MKKIIRIFAVVLFVLQITNIASALAADSFNDIAGHQYKTAIEYLHAHNIIGGYPDGSFKPDGQINRADLLKILVGGAGYTDPDATQYKNCFSDVHEEWYAKYVCFAKSKGWVTGFLDGSFKPEQAAVKVEAMKMLLNSEGFPIVDKASGKSIYDDVNFSEWYGPYMFMAEAMKIVDIAGSNYGTYGFVTRGEISDNIYRAVLILDQKVGSFDNVVIPDTNGGGVVNPPVVNYSFDVPVLTATSTDPSKILLKWTVPSNTGDSALKNYVLEYKLENDLDYKTTDYSVEYYNEKVKIDGGIVFASVPSTMYHFRLKAVNLNGHVSDYSAVQSLMTAQPLEPAAPTVEVLSQTFTNITLKVTLPKYTGDSALDSIFDSFTDPNNGSAEGGSTNIEGNNIGSTWTVPFNFKPNADSPTQPIYEFTFWVNNKNGKLSQKTVLKVSGLSSSPNRPVVTTSLVTKNSIDFKVMGPAYTGDMPLDEYFYNKDSSSDGSGNVIAGGYGKNYFENTLNNMMHVEGLSPNTTYVFSFWVRNLDGRSSAKVTQTVTTPAN